MRSLRATRTSRPLNVSLLLILGALGLAASGCRVDKASKESSELDSGNGAPSMEARRPSPQANAIPTAPVPAQTVPVAQDPRPRIVCFGDSLTAGFGTEAGQSYPDYLQAALDAQGYRYRVVNQGISGNTTKDGVDRVENVLALKPAVVIVEFGGNDGLRGLRIEDSRANLDTIIAKIVATLKPSGTRVLIAGITLPPDYGPDYIQQFTQTYTLLGTKYHVPVMPFLLKDVFGTPGLMQADNTHATAAGNKLVAKNILPYVQPLLKK